MGCCLRVKIGPCRASVEHDVEVPFFDAPRLGESMNKLTTILIIALMSCVLCGCMSEEEWRQKKEVLVADLDSAHPEWGSKNQDYVLKGTIAYGMTVEQVEWVWWSIYGNRYTKMPSDWDEFDRNSYYFELLSVSPNRESRSAPWYMHGSSGRLYLDFYDGKLESWSWYPRRY